MKKPTLEEVKEHFKEAKTVRCLRTKKERLFNPDFRFEYVDTGISCFVHMIHSSEFTIIWNSISGFAPIVEFKDTEKVDSTIKDLNITEPQLSKPQKQLLQKKERFPINTILHTKDGRHIGNAIVIEHTCDTGRNIIKTDYGNTCAFTDDEVDELFYKAFTNLTPSEVYLYSTIAGVHKHAVSDKTRPVDRITLRDTGTLPKFTLDYPLDLNGKEDKPSRKELRHKTIDYYCKILKTNGISKEMIEGIMAEFETKLKDFAS